MVTFIETWSSNKYFGNSSAKKFRQLFSVKPIALLKRIGMSFMPPFVKGFDKVYVDLVGPLLAIVILFFLANFAYTFKSNHSFIRPTTLLFYYTLGMPAICWALIKLGNSPLKLIQTITLLGYALYGPIITLSLSYIAFAESSFSVFFLTLILFTGSANFRLIMIFIKTMPEPAIRLIVCSFIGVIQILFTIYINFAYVRKTY